MIYITTNSSLIDVGDADVENHQRSTVEKSDANLSSNVVENKNKTGPLLEVRSAIIEGNHLPTARIEGEADLSRSVFRNSKSLEKAADRYMASIQDENTWISMSMAQYSPFSNEHGIEDNIYCIIHNLKIKIISTLRYLYVYKKYYCI